MGHAFNHTLMDILDPLAPDARPRHRSGSPASTMPASPPRWSSSASSRSAGNAGRREMGREAFVAKVWEWKEQSGGTILEQSRRLGDSFDLSRNRFTMDPGFHDAVLKVFVDFYDRGLIYRGKRLVNWDPHFETAISDLEVEQVETKGHLWRLRYPLEDGATYQHPVAFDDDGDADRLRDPRLPRRRHHPPRDHARRHRRRRPPRRPALSPTSSARPSACRWSAARSRSSPTPTPTPRRAPAPSRSPRPTTSTTGRSASAPASPRSTSWTPAPASRSRTTPPSGRATDPADELADLDGLDRYEARELIVTLAEEQGWLDGIDEETHTVPHGDRSKVAIEPFLTDQWYVDAATLAGPALAAVRDGRTRILPESQEKTYYHWLENIEPWCISRQLWWGHQIPVWYGPTTSTQDFCPSTLQTPMRTAVFQTHPRTRLLRTVEAMVAS